jgi:OFA family oxalate/formate antiporter-like MFS transporter
MNRWYRLAAAVVAMVMIGNLQYAWTMAVQPIMTATGWTLSEVQWGFSFFIAVMTWTMPLSGWMIDRLGPRAFMTVAGALCAIGWGGIAFAQSLPQFYVLYSIAGLGNSFVYCCSTALGLKWFPDRRGIASGLIAAGYGSGAAFFNPLFGAFIRAEGYQTTFLYTGIVLGAVVVLAGQFLKYPPQGYIQAPPGKTQVRRQTEQFTSMEMLRTPQFYMLYAMMLAIGIGGLMATAQVAPVGRNFGVSVTAMMIALTLNPLCNGGARIGWGWVSDSLGREKTMALAFGLQALFLASVVTLGRMGDAWFVVTMALVFLTWGELYVLFPTVSADMFGARHAASNYALLYSTKGVASILAGGLAATLFEATGTWNYAFYGSAVLALCSALGGLALLRMPLPTKRGSKQAAEGALRASAGSSPR